MIFLTVGSSHFQFHRLLREVDFLISAGVLSDLVAQTGLTHYAPRNYAWRPFMTSQDMRLHLQKAEFVICHGGCGTLNECLGLRKKIIVVPRLARFAEAPDNHQMEIVDLLGQANSILVVREIHELQQRLGEVKTWEPNFERTDGSSLAAQILDRYIQSAFVPKTSNRGWLSILSRFRFM